MMLHMRVRVCARDSEHKDGYWTVTATCFECGVVMLELRSICPDLRVWVRMSLSSAVCARAYVHPRGCVRGENCAYK